jgi:aminopeptidase N
LSTGILARRNATAKTFAEPDAVPNYGPSRTSRILHYELWLSLEPVAKSYRGEARIRLEALPSYQGTVSLDFCDAVLDAVTDDEGNALAYRHLGEVLEIDASDLDVVKLRWHGEPPSAGLYFTGPIPNEPERPHMVWSQCQDEDAHCFIPCHDHPSIKHRWTIHLDAPAGFRLLSNGSEGEYGEQNERAFAHFEQDEPMPAYLFTVVAAKLEGVTSEWRGRPVRYFVPVGRTEAIERSMGRTPEMLEAFSLRLGVDYPWPRYDQVVVDDFIFGGMENVACTLMADYLLVDAKAAQHWDPESLVAHELAHQWFGDLLTCQDWSQGWLNESWATYMEALWWEADRDEVETAWYRLGTAAGYLDEERTRYRRPIVTYAFKSPIDVFDRHLYNKGAGVLHTLRNLMGEAPFWAGVRLYLDRHRHSTVHTRHFQRALEDASGTNLDAFFEQWIWSAGHPKLDVSLSESEGLLLIKVAQTQQGEETPDAFHFNLGVEVIFEDGSSQAVTFPVRERDNSFALPLEQKVATVRVDPGFNVLAEITIKASVAWLKRLLTDTCPVLATRAAAALVSEGAHEGMDAVRQALSNHSFWGVRSDIAGKLGRLGGSRQRDALLGALDGETEPRVRAAILSALGNFREPAVATRLMEATGPEDTWHVQSAALVALGTTLDPRARAHLQEHLAVESWQHTVVMQTLTGLGKTRDPAVLDTLLEYSRAPYPTRVRAAAAGAMAALGDRVESVRTPVVERLIEMLREPGHRCKYLAIVGLGRLKDPRAAGALSTLHQNDPVGRFKRAAYESLSMIRAGRNTEEGLAGLRRELEKVQAENRKLRDRLESLEHKVDRLTGE